MYFFHKSKDAKSKYWEIMKSKKSKHKLFLQKNNNTSDKVHYKSEPFSNYPNFPIFEEFS